MKKKYQLIDRAKFIVARYENFLKTKKYIASLPPEHAKHCFVTDLDRIYDGETKPQKDIVLCDRCNEDINDPAFVMLEGSYVYHRECVKDELPEGFGQSIENVVFLDQFRNDEDDDGGAA